MINKDRLKENFRAVREKSPLVHNITRIRQKIGQYGSCIITRAGFGYGFGN